MLTKKSSPKAAQNTFTFDFTSLRSGTKQLIVLMAVYGLVSSSFATWLIRLGGLQND
jgi:hypothetical protein